MLYGWIFHTDVWWHIIAVWNTAVNPNLETEFFLLYVCMQSICVNIMASTKRLRECVHCICVRDRYLKHNAGIFYYSTLICHILCIWFFDNWESDVLAHNIFFILFFIIILFLNYSCVLLSYSVHNQTFLILPRWGTITLKHVLTTFPKTRASFTALLMS